MFLNRLQIVRFYSDQWLFTAQGDMGMASINMQ